MTDAKIIIIGQEDMTMTTKEAGITLPVDEVDRRDQGEVVKEVLTEVAEQGAGAEVDRVEVEEEEGRDHMKASGPLRINHVPNHLHLKVNKTKKHSVGRSMSLFQE